MISYSNKVNDTNLNLACEPGRDKLIQEICNDIQNHKSYEGELIYKWKDKLSGEKIENILLYKYLPDLEWVIAVGTDKISFWYPYRNKIILNLSIAIALFIMMLMVVRILSVKIAAQLSLLLSVVKSYTKTDFKQRVEVKSNDEIAELSIAFNQLADELQDYYEQLEQKVQERTTELYLKNKELQKQKIELEYLIEDLKNTQKQLIQAEKMAALGQLISGIAHEINSPLGAIKASVSNLLIAIEETVQDLPDLMRALNNKQIDYLIWIIKLSNNSENI